MKAMKPDIYQTRNNSHPVTALAAWMSHARIGRNAAAKKAGVAINTMASAMRGSVRLSTAELISQAVPLPAQVISDGHVQGEWTLNLKADGSIEVKL